MLRIAAYILLLSIYTDLVYSASVMDDNETSRSTVSGIVVDTQTGEPVSFAYLHLEQINRTTTTDRDGRFQLRNVPEGSYTVMVHRIGYISTTQTISVDSEDETELRLEMTSTVLSGQAVEVVGDAEITRGARIEHASIKVVGDQLRRDLDVTLSSTLSNQAGFAERSMGPAPGRPVIRGMGDERVKILEDGGATGDVSWTAGDHSVTVDPSSADEIEIARGPAALEHSSGAIGGVINVVRNQIPNSVPTRTTGSISTQGSSVNQGLMAGGNIKVPWNNDFVFNLDLNGRIGQDYNTPVGRLTNSYIQTTSNGLGASYIRPWGYAGVSGSMYLSEYGIPPDPQGGHPAGVDIEMSKYQFDGRSEVLLNRSIFKLLEARASFTRYHHVELEASGNVGTQFDMNTMSGSVKLRTRGRGIFEDGVIGVWSEFIDYSVFGSRTPNSNSWSGAIFAVQEADIGRLHLEGGVRLNHTSTWPVRERPNSFIGHIRQRDFTGLESSFSAIYNAGKGFFLGSTLMHSWRAPSMEELYSEGPHLGVFAFEVGNPELGSERGLGTELFVRYNTQNASFQLAGFNNRFGNFLHTQDTGQPSVIRGDLNEFRYVETEATIYGAEISSEFEILNNLVFDGNFSLTIGDRVVSEEEKEATGLTESEQPLPQIPPLNGNLALRYSVDNFTFGGRLRLAAKQDRLGEFESSTDGYTVFDLNAQYRFNWGTTLHTVTLNGLNLLNEEHYNHLSLVKEIFPEPGRSVNLLYRVYF